MLGTSFILVSSLWAAGGNLCLRKNMDYKGSVNGYLVAYYLFSLVISLFSLFLFSKGHSPFSLTMFTIGGTVGVLNVLLMLLVGKTLSLGPAGLSFAFVSTAAIVPSLILPLIFGEPYGFVLSIGLIIGLICILSGLFWGALSQGDQKFSSFKWLAFACSLLAVQGLILSVIQWRCLLTDPNVPSHPLLLFQCNPNQEAWFMPGMFTFAFLLQSIIFIVNERRIFNYPEMGFGMLGGLANGAATLFLLYATQAATPIEKGILFPCSAIATIIACNLWGQYLYNEKVNWKANALCSFGIFLGAVA